MGEIVYTKTKWTEVHRVMKRMLAAFEDEDDSTMMMACLAFAIVGQCETYTLEQLKDGIKGASEWIALYASSLDPNVKAAN